MIDLGTVSLQVQTLLDQVGLDWSHRVTVTLWQHRHGDTWVSGPEIVLSIVGPAPGYQCLSGYGVTIDGALAELARKVDAHVRPPVPIAVEQLQVVLPTGAAVDRDHFGHPA